MERAILATVTASRARVSTAADKMREQLVRQHVKLVAELRSALAGVAYGGRYRL
jgi:hypothetical protein